MLVYDTMEFDNGMRGEVLFLERLVGYKLIMFNYLHIKNLPVTHV